MSLLVKPSRVYSSSATGSPVGSIAGSSAWASSAPGSHGDQATRLRALMAERHVAPETRAPDAPSQSFKHSNADQSHRSPARSAVTIRRGCPLITVASGKGGVGKTTLATNLSVAMSQAGTRVTLVDADLGMANADLMLGISPTRRMGPDTLNDTCSLRRLAVPTPSGVRLVPGATGIAELADLEVHQRRMLVMGVLDLTTDTDAMIIDSSAGAGRTTLGFTAAADSVVLVTTPDPAAMADAYATLKCLASRASTNNAAEQIGRVGIVVNMADSSREAEAVFDRLAAASARFLGARPVSVGWIPRDQRVARAVRSGESLLAGPTRSRAAGHIRQIAEVIAELVVQWHARFREGVRIEVQHHARSMPTELTRESSEAAPDRQNLRFASPDRRGA